MRLSESHLLSSTLITPLTILLSAESEHDPTYLENLFGRRKRWPKGLPSVFDNCKMIFRKTGKAGTKRVFWITNQDDPVPGSRSAEAHRKCLESIRAAKKVGIEFDPYLISKPNAPRFRIGKFYSVSSLYALLYGAFD